MQKCSKCGCETFQEYSTEKCIQQGVRIRDDFTRDYDLAGTIDPIGNGTEILYLECENCQERFPEPVPVSTAILPFKTFYFHLTEYNGEREYGEDYLVYAADLDEAERLAHEYAKSYFCDDEPEFDGDNQYAFYCGQNIIEVGTIEEMSMEDFIERLLSGAIINEPDN